MIAWYTVCAQKSSDRELDGWVFCRALDMVAALNVFWTWRDSMCTCGSWREAIFITQPELAEDGIFIYIRAGSSTYIRLAGPPAE